MAEILYGVVAYENLIAKKDSLEGYVQQDATFFVSQSRRDRHARNLAISKPGVSILYLDPVGMMVSKPGPITEMTINNKGEVLPK